MIICRPNLGLANRLFALTSSMRVCDVLDRPMKLDWQTSSHCGAKFTDLFSNSFKQGKNCKVNKVFNCKIPSPSKSHFVIFANSVVRLHGERKVDLHPYFSKLVLNADLSQKVKCFLQKNNGFENVIGVHIRKTDKAKSDNDIDFLKYLDDKYMNVLSKVIDRYPKFRFFIATDEKRGEEKFVERFGDKIIHYPKTRWPLNKKGVIVNRSVESVQQSLIDMWLLSSTQMVIYGLGSFGVCSTFVNSIPGVNIEINAHYNIFSFIGRRKYKTISEQEVINAVCGMIDRNFMAGKKEYQFFNPKYQFFDQNVKHL